VFLSAPDAYENEKFKQAIDKKSGDRTRAILCMPIRAEGYGVIGVLQLINKESGSYVFTQQDEDVMNIFLSIGGPILAASNLYNQLQGKGNKKSE
jgi:GAF domain-containing protein